MLFARDFKRVGGWKWGTMICKIKNHQYFETLSRYKYNEMSQLLHIFDTSTSYILNLT